MVQQITIATSKKSFTTYVEFTHMHLYFNQILNPITIFTKLLLDIREECEIFNEIDNVANTQFS